MFENVDDGRTPTDDGRMDAGSMGILLAHRWAFGSGELKNKINFFYKFSPIDLLIILYQMIKFEAPSCYSFQDIMITNFQSPNLQREIIRKK